jgi:hypothetical protein
VSRATRRVVPKGLSVAKPLTPARQVLRPCSATRSGQTPRLSGGLDPAPARSRPTNPGHANADRGCSLHGCPQPRGSGPFGGKRGDSSRTMSVREETGCVEIARRYKEYLNSHIRHELVTKCPLSCPWPRRDRRPLGGPPIHGPASDAGVSLSARPQDTRTLLVRSLGGPPAGPQEDGCCVRSRPGNWRASHASQWSSVSRRDGHAGSAVLDGGL